MYRLTLLNKQTGIEHSFEIAYDQAINVFNALTGDTEELSVSDMLNALPLTWQEHALGTGKDNVKRMYGAWLLNCLLG